MTKRILGPAIWKLTGIMAATTRIVGDLTSTSRESGVTQGSTAVTITHYVRIRSYLHAARNTTGVQRLKIIPANAANYTGQIRIVAAPTAVWKSGLFAKDISAIWKLTGIMAATTRNVGDLTSTRRDSGVTQGSTAMTITHYVRIGSYLHAARNTTGVHKHLKIIPAI